MDWKDRTVFQFEVDLYFLCNPWLEADTFGLASKEQIAEYVMNEHGQIYLGTSDRPRPIPWYFGQYESTVLPTALALLEKTPKPQDSTLIPRLLATKIRSDPQHELRGIFGPVPSIRPLPPPPVGYVSAPAILNQYLRSDHHQGNHYDTNWQHAAILCSLCRALGIPCRPVTVYNANNGGIEQTEQRSAQSNNRLVVETTTSRSVRSSSPPHALLRRVRSDLRTYGWNVGCIATICPLRIRVGKS